MRFISLLLILFSSVFTLSAQPQGGSQAIRSWKTAEQALWVDTDGGSLCIQPYESGSIHIMFGAREKIGQHTGYAVPVAPEVISFQVKENQKSLLMSTAKYSLSIDKEKGFLTLMDKDGKVLLREMPGKARNDVLGGRVAPFCRFRLDDKEAIYGLGQFRDYRLNLRDSEKELFQVNRQAAVPVLYSTKGWGIFWNNPALTFFKDDASGMSFCSDWGEVVDYYLFTGSSLDGLVASYRALTGAAPMIPDWSLGYHQSRNKYSTQDEVLSIARKMKEHDLKMSTLFVDYYYWKKYGTGSHRFDETLFPDVPAMLEKLHREYDTKLVVTVWPTFKPGTENYQKMDRAGFLLHSAEALDGIIYDPFNPEARKMYWELVSPLVDLGIDGWFLDGPEPDMIDSFLPTMTHAGPARKVRNLYPLVHSAGFREGLSLARKNLRPYMLTRCAWAAQQRNGTAIWSGDVGTDFEELKKQIVAGLNFTATGIPYWTTDIGGYAGGDPADPAYQEVFARWFEYGTFCPVFRAHGRRYPGNRKTPNEPWAYGTEVENICRDYIDLRYRLMPYIYSLSGMTTLQHYTPMRLLAFDFPKDEKVLDCKDEFMYGPALLVCPVTEAGARERPVYLPEGAQWRDYWSGKSYEGGQDLLVQAPLHRIPLFIRIGSIIPMSQKAVSGIDRTAPLDLCIYKGADGVFELYEDDGTTLDYQKGIYNLIRFSWDDSQQALKITPLHNGKASSPARTLRIQLIGEDGATVKEYTYQNREAVVRF